MTTLLVLFSLITAVSLIAMAVSIPLLEDIAVISRQLWRERPCYRAPRPRFLRRTWKR